MEVFQVCFLILCLTVVSSIRVKRNTPGWFEALCLPPSPAANVGELRKAVGRCETIYYNEKEQTCEVYRMCNEGPHMLGHFESLDQCHRICAPALACQDIICAEDEKCEILHPDCAFRIGVYTVYCKDEAHCVPKNPRGHVWPERELERGG